MKCANHPATDSVAFCSQCGRALCAECKREVRGVVYCENCLATRLQSPGLAHVLGSGAGPSPGIALCLGFIPGVGAIYNGQVVKGMIQVLLFASLLALEHRGGDAMSTIFSLAAAAFYFYMVIDSYQTARRKLLGLRTEEWFGLGNAKLNAPVGAGIMIGLGVLFLLDNFGFHVFREVSRFWPVLLIALGFLLLQRRIRGGGTPPPPPSGPSSEPPSGPTNIPGARSV